MKISESIHINIAPLFINTYYRAMQEAEFSTSGGDHYIVRLEDFAEFDVPVSEYAHVMEKMAEYDTADGLRNGEISKKYINNVLNKGNAPLQIYFNSARFSEKFERHYAEIRSLIEQGLIYGARNAQVAPYEPGVFLTSLYTFLSGYTMGTIAKTARPGSFFGTPLFLLCDSREKNVMFSDGSARMFFNICSQELSHIDMGPTLRDIYQRHLIRHEDLHIALKSILEQEKDRMHKLITDKMFNKGITDGKKMNDVFSRSLSSEKGKNAIVYNVEEAYVEALDLTYAPELAAVSFLGLTTLIKDLSRPNPDSPFLEGKDSGVVYLARLASLARLIGERGLQEGLEPALDSGLKKLLSTGEYEAYLIYKEYFSAIHDVSQESIRPLVAERYPSLLKPLVAE